MSTDHLSDRIRSRLAHYPTPVDTDAILNRIRTKRKRGLLRKGRLWPFVLFLIFLGGGLWTWKGVASSISIHADQQPALAVTDDNDQSGKMRSPSIGEIKSRASTSDQPRKAYNRGTALGVHHPDDDVSVHRAAGSSLQAEPFAVASRDEHLRFHSVRDVLRTMAPAHLKSEHRDVPLPPHVMHTIPATKTRPSLSIGLRLSPERAFKSVHSAFASVEETRRATEIALEAYSAELLFKWHTPKGFSVSGGLAYQRINEKLEWENETVEVVREGDQFFREMKRRQKTTYNAIELVDISVFLGFEKRRHRWVYGANAGAYINVYTGARGEIVTPEAEPGVFSNLSHGVFRQRIGLRPAVHASIAYQIHPSLRLSIEPGFVFQSKNMIESEQLFQQRYGFARIRFGLNWMLR